MSYYIKGVIGRGEEVIELLKSKGGIDTGDLFGRNSQTLYYIGRENRISSTFENSATAYLVTKYLTELTLPEKKTWKPKFKVGDYFRDNIQSEVIGKITRIAEDESYIVHLIGYSPGGRVLEKDIIPWEPKRGERVLVRDSTSGMWKEAIYSFKSNLQGYIQHYAVGGTYWSYCIPFDENKLGKVTD